MSGIAMERQTEVASLSSMMSDEELVMRAQSGEAAAFDTIVERYKDRVFSYACRMLGDAEIARETAQEIFLRAYRYIDRFRGDSKFSTWFYTIVTSSCKNAAAFYGYRARHSDHRAPAFEDGSPADPIDRAPDFSFAPHVIVSRRDIQRTVREAIESLSEPYRQTIVMKDINDLSYEEMAKIMNCQLGTVKSRLSRARLMMREKLAAAGLSGSECD
jgi:RNA polymerase sigma-70 factor, ECF subfamily